VVEVKIDVILVQYPFDRIVNDKIMGARSYVYLSFRYKFWFICK